MHPLLSREPDLASSLIRHVAHASASAQGLLPCLGTKHWTSSRCETVDVQCRCISRRRIRKLNMHDDAWPVSPIAALTSPCIHTFLSWACQPLQARLALAVSLHPPFQQHLASLSLSPASAAQPESEGTQPLEPAAVARPPWHAAS